MTVVGEDVYLQGTAGELQTLLMSALEVALLPLLLRARELWLDCHFREALGVEKGLHLATYFVVN